MSITPTSDALPYKGEGTRIRLWSQTRGAMELTYAKYLHDEK
jgi:hypothetical protein